MSFHSPVPLPAVPSDPPSHSRRIPVPTSPTQTISTRHATPTLIHDLLSTSAADTDSVAAPTPRPGASYADAESSDSRLLFEEIEMEAITPSGHRRRRSSLINPANGAAGASRSSRPRAQSIRNPATGDEEPKIPEEENETDGTRSDERGDGSDLSDEDLHDDEETGLTRKDKRRKRQKKRRNTRLDQRIAREKKITDEEKREADQNVAKKITINCVLIGLWYIFSLSISLYNKWMFDSDRLNFPFPLFTTSVHMLVQFSLASLVLYFIPSLRPQHPHKSDQGQSRHEADPERSPLMTKMFYLTRIGPCGAATSLDIGLGNTSLKFITLTFYTMCKSSSLAFVLLFAFLFRLEAPTWKLVAIIATMTAGVVMMVAGEVEFKLGGFILVISAAFFSGFRWGLTQILLLRNPATSNPFSSIFFLAPVMFLTLIAIAIPVEGVFPLLDGLSTLSNEWGVLVTPLLIVFPGTIAFLMTASEFALLQRTSVVTLSIAGIFKEAVTISAAALVFGDTLTPVNVSGLFITLGAIIAYNWIKISKMRADAQVDAHRGHLEQDATGGGSGSGSGSGGFTSTSNSDSDPDDDDDEDVGLLRRSVEVEDALFTVDGDLIPKPESSSGLAEATRSEHKITARED